MLAIAIIIVLFNIYKKKSPQGIYTISSLKLRLPIIGNLNKKIIVSRVYKDLIHLTISRCFFSTCPANSCRGTGKYKVAEDAVIKIRERVVRGDGLSTPIRENDIFPKMLSSMIKIGEESGALDSILNKTADFYDDEVEQTIQTTTALIEPPINSCSRASNWNNSNFNNASNV